MRGAAAFLVILSVVLMFPELLYIAFSLVLFFAIVSFTPLSAEGHIEIERNNVVVGARNRAKVIITTGKGIGIVFVNIALPDEFEALSNNVKAFFTVKGAEKEFQFEFICSKRGEYQIEARIEIRDVLGRKVKTHTVGKADLTVRPVMAKIKRMKIRKSKSKIPLPQTGASRMGVLTTDFRDIRPYSNDPFKYINWKASARLYGRYKTLLVNDFEREGKKTIILFLDTKKAEGSNIENTLETAIELALAVTHIAVRSSINIGIYLLGNEELIMPSSGKDQFYRIINRLSRVEPNKWIPEEFEKAVERYRRIILEYNPLVIVLTTINSRNIGEFEKGIRKLTSMRVRSTLINVIPYDFYDKKEKHIDTMLGSLLKLYSRRLNRCGARVINWNPRKTKSVKMLQVM